MRGMSPRGEQASSAARRGGCGGCAPVVVLVVGGVEPLSEREQRRKARIVVALVLWREPPGVPAVRCEAARTRVLALGGLALAQRRLALVANGGGVWGEPRCTLHAAAAGSLLAKEAKRAKAKAAATPSESEDDGVALT